MFKMTVSGAESFEVAQECVKSVSFTTDIPMDSNARTADVGTTMIVKGKILTAVDGDQFDSTRQLAQWSSVPAENSSCYRNVVVENIRGGLIERKYTFPNAFVVDYVESYGDTEGVGTFTLKIKQKKDKITDVAIEGGYAADA